MYMLDPFNKPPMQQQQPSSNALPPFGQQQQQQQRPCQHQPQPMQVKLNQQQLNQINQQQQQQQQQNPSNPQQQFTPILIAVEPRNDESVRCDCRNCQFFSGWCCMPCALLIIIMIIVCYACMKGAAPDADEAVALADHWPSSTTGVSRTALNGRASGGAYETITF